MILMKIFVIMMSKLNSFWYLGLTEYRSIQLIIPEFPDLPVQHGKYLTLCFTKLCHFKCLFVIEKSTFNGNIMKSTWIGLEKYKI